LQSYVLALLTAVIGYASGRLELLLVALILAALKGWLIPRLLWRAVSDLGVSREVQPFVNVPTSVLVSGLLVLAAYLVSGPVVAQSHAPTRAALPLGLAVVFVGLFILVSRKQAITQIVGFLVLENGIALLAVLATYGVPFIIELGVTLDLLLGFLIMQVFVYRINQTFDSLDVQQLAKLKD
jgi:hydrogenase-4 component E